MIAVAFLPCVNGAAERYTIDSARTVVSFEVRSFGVFRQRGGFDTTLGSVQLDAQSGEGDFDVVIDARSVHSGSKAVQRMIRGKGFLDVERYPNIFYKAEQAIFSNGEPVLIEGELTLLSVTHAVPLRVTGFRCGMTPNSVQRRCIVDASAVFKRSEFGMTGFIPFTIDRIRLVIHAEATADSIDEGS